MWFLELLQKKKFPEISSDSFYSVSDKVKRALISGHLRTVWCSFMMSVSVFSKSQQTKLQ